MGGSVKVGHLVDEHTGVRDSWYEQGHEDY